MAIAAEEAAYAAIVARCSGAPGAPWGTRVYPYIAPAGVARPYVVYALSGGGAGNLSNARRDAELVMMVKVLTDTLPTALAAAAQLRDLLDDGGIYDNRRDGQPPMGYGSNWIINTTTVELTIALQEIVDGKPIHHQGFQLRMVLKEV